MNKLGTRIAIGKWYWDTGFDFELFSHPVALNLLYLQATAEVERGWIPVKDDLRRRLSTLQDKNKKEEVISLQNSFLNCIHTWNFIFNSCDIYFHFSTWKLLDL